MKMLILVVTKNLKVKNEKIMRLEDPDRNEASFPPRYPSTDNRH